jgi:hypothetical protein
LAGEPGMVTPVMMVDTKGKAQIVFFHFYVASMSGGPGLSPRIQEIRPVGHVRPRGRAATWLYGPPRRRLPAASISEGSRRAAGWLADESAESGWLSPNPEAARRCRSGPLAIASFIIPYLGWQAEGGSGT